MLGVYNQDDTLITMEIMGCQVHAIGNAIKPFLQIRSQIMGQNL